MACYYPIDGWTAKTANPNGKYSIVFEKSAAQLDSPVKISCSRCIGCKLERSRQWAMRCTHEASLHEDNCFITLTYDDDHIPQGNTLVTSDLQKFFKRLRRSLPGKKIRFYACGEYGENRDILTLDTLGRPHYHALIFGYNFPDQVLQDENNGVPIFTSKKLEKLWTYGFSTVGECNFESAAYIARYCTKKINGDMAEEHYKFTDYTTGEIYDRKPEFSTQSRRPGIASDWFKKHKKDLEKDFLTVNGKKQKIPKYYDKLFEEDEPEIFLKIKQNRSYHIDKDDPENQYPRLRIKEKIKLKKLKQLKRNL